MSKYLISFKSGHYKTFDGACSGDSAWMRFEKSDGTILCVNKDKVEYVEHSEPTKANEGKQRGPDVTKPEPVYEKLK